MVATDLLRHRGLLLAVFHLLAQALFDVTTLPRLKVIFESLPKVDERTDPIV